MMRCSDAVSQSKQDVDPVCSHLPISAREPGHQRTGLVQRTPRRFAPRDGASGGLGSRHVSAKKGRTCGQTTNPAPERESVPFLVGGPRLLPPSRTRAPPCLNEQGDTTAAGCRATLPCTLRTHVKRVAPWHKRGLRESGERARAVTEDGGSSFVLPQHNHSDEHGSRGDRTTSSHPPSVRSEAFCWSNRTMKQSETRNPS